MSTTAVAVEPRRPPRLALRPLVLPNEHGGWGFLFEPIVLGLIVAPSAAGALVGLGAVAAFLTRHPFKLAASDWLRHRRYPRTGACEAIAAVYIVIAMAALLAAMWIARWQIAIPLMIAAPFALVQLGYDAKNRGRAALPEIAGSLGMSSVAATIALAAGKPMGLAATLSLIAICRSVPAILYVRALLGRGRGAIGAHIAAVAVAVALGRVVLMFVFVALLARAIVGLASEQKPPAKRIGFVELAWGAASIIASGIAFVV